MHQKSFDPARRQLLISAASSAALVSLGTNAQAPSPTGCDVCPAKATPEPPDSTLATDGSHRLTVNVNINGLGPYRFLVDTGADRSVVAAEVAAAIGLHPGGAVMLRGVVRAVAADTVAIAELSCGSIGRHNLLLPTLSAALLDADGYLGLDLLDSHRVVLDFKGHTLQVTESLPRFSSLWMAPSEVRVRAAGTSGHLRAVNCLVDGIAATAFIDTGAELSAGNTALLTAMMKRNERHPPLSPVSLTDVTGGVIYGSATTVRRVQLNEVTFTDCPLVVADFEVFDVWGLGSRPALLIGVNFLQHFSRVSIDYGLKEIRFDLASLGRPPTSVIDLS